MFNRPVPLEIRTAVPEDGPAIAHLLAHSFRPPVHAWVWEDCLGQETFLVACDRRRPVGALLALPDAGPVAWVRLAALANGIGVGPWLDATLPPLTKPLRRLGARVLAWIDASEWAGPALGPRGFRTFTRLVTLVKQTRWLPPASPSAARLRPATPADILPLMRLDHAAFSPPWWLSGATLDWLRRESACFLLAEQDGRLLGYIEGQQTAGGAHIGRLAVIPQAQGLGIGHLLLAGGLSLLWEQGVEQVTLNTQQENRVSQRLYDHLGFRPTDRRIPVWGRWL